MFVGSTLTPRGRWRWPRGAAYVQVGHDGHDSGYFPARETYDVVLRAEAMSRSLRGSPQVLPRNEQIRVTGLDSLTCSVDSWLSIHRQCQSTSWRSLCAMAHARRPVDETVASGRASAR